MASLGTARTADRGVGLQGSTKQGARAQGAANSAQPQLQQLPLPRPPQLGPAQPRPGCIPQVATAQPPAKQWGAPPSATAATRPAGSAQLAPPHRPPARLRELSTGPPPPLSPGAIAARFSREASALAERLLRDWAPRRAASAPSAAARAAALAVASEAAAANPGPDNCGPHSWAYRFARTLGEWPADPFDQSAAAEAMRVRRPVSSSRVHLCLVSHHDRPSVPPIMLRAAY